MSWERRVDSVTPEVHSPLSFWGMQEGTMKYLWAAILTTTLAFTIYGCDDGDDGCNDASCRADCRADDYDDGSCGIYSGDCLCFSCDDCDSVCVSMGYDVGNCNAYGECECGYDELPCMAPAGTYSCVWGDHPSGTCSSDIADALLDQECWMRIEDTECGLFELEEHDSNPPCDYAVYYSGECDADGPVIVNVTVDVTGEGCPATCHHFFTMLF
jgi:hypothetical protein